MSYVTSSSVKGRRLAIWSGYLLAAISAFHLVLGLVIAREFIPGWLTGTLRGTEMPAMTESVGWFWGALGGFAVPMCVLGLLIAHLAKAGHLIPWFVPAILGAWLLVGAAIFEPGGFPAGVLIVAGLTVAGRRQRKAGQSEPSTRSKPST